MDLISQLHQTIDPAMASLGFNVVRIHLTSTTNPVLQVMIEKPDLTPIAMDDCVKASREISALMDVMDPLPSAYRLEVTSTGLDRPLMKWEDFQRFEGHKVKLETIMMLEGRKRFQGLIVEATADAVTLVLDTDPDCEVEIPTSSIRKAKLDPDFEFELLQRKG